MRNRHKTYEKIVPLATKDCVPGEKIDFKATTVNENSLKQMLALDCPQCHSKKSFRPVGVAFTPNGEVLMGECKECGIEVESAVVTRPCFTWRFDNGNREVMWDTIRLLQLVAKHEKDLVIATLPLKLIDFYIEINGENAVADTAYAMTRDLSEPVISIEHPSDLISNIDVPPILVVDGWHRLYKAHQLRQTLRSYILPRSLEMKVRVKDVTHDERSPDRNHTRGDFESAG